MEHNPIELNSMLWEVHLIALIISLSNSIYTIYLHRYTQAHEGTKSRFLGSLLPLISPFYNCIECRNHCINTNSPMNMHQLII